MPISPDHQDPARPAGETGGANPFAGFGAGLNFFQDWMKAASSAMPHMGTPAGSAGAPAWAMPTLDPEEIDKRIQELKTVQFWLEQNARMLAMTVQTLEVQRMTLQTLKDMKVPLEALKDSLQAGGSLPQAAAFAPSGTAASGAPVSPTEKAAAVNPMQWWSALTQQFSSLASQAVQASQEAMGSRPGPAAGKEDADAQEGSDDRPTGTAPPSQGLRKRPGAGAPPEPRRSPRPPKA